MKYLRVFDRYHNILDEIRTYDNLNYGWTLNDVDTLEFNLSLTDNKCSQINTQYFNHIEIIDEKNISIWGGIIAGRNFSDAKLKINCLSYEALLKFRRLRATTYGGMDYGTLLSQLIDSTNAINPSGVSIGSIDSGSLQTALVTTNTDMLLDKIKSLTANVNYDFDITARAFNFYIRKGADKPKYTLTYGGDADNIILAPERAEDILSMANAVYSEANSLSSVSNGSRSQSLYGLVESTITADNSATTQSILDAQTAGSLYQTAYPANSFTIKTKDSTLCPFSDIIIGDAVTVNLIPYFNFSSLMRIIRMVHDENTSTRDITFGTVIYRPQRPVKKLYKYWGNV
jgi:hypothetical protein